MKRIQFFLTVNEGKWLIAEAVSRMAPVRQALEKGSVVFKGGTTVSCVSELITGTALRVSGRNTPNGAKSAKTLESSIHTLLWKDGKAQSLDDSVIDGLLELKADDVLIIGANIIDSDGNAALLAGSPAGATPGRALSTMTTEGFNVIIAAGLEKLVPGKVGDSVRSAGRKGVSSAYGMACGLLPLFGKVVTELEAVRILSDVEVSVIGRGGVLGAEGGVLLQASGEDEQILILESIVQRCKGKHLSGDPASLIECEVPSPGCKTHLSCCYREMKGERKQ